MSRKKLEARVRVRVLQLTVPVSDVTAVQMRRPSATRALSLVQDGRALCSPTGVGRGITCTR